MMYWKIDNHLSGDQWWLYDNDENTRLRVAVVSDYWQAYVEGDRPNIYNRPIEIRGSLQEVKVLCEIAAKLEG